MIRQNTVVLVMDRRDEDSKLITSLLEKTGFSVIQSANQAEAVDLCRTGNHAVPLVIIDTAILGISVPELLDQVQAANPQISVLLTSNQDESEPIGHRSLTGIVRGHLRRPFRRAQFLGSVLEAVKAPLVRTA